MDADNADTKSNCCAFLIGGVCVHLRPNIFLCVSAVHPNS